MRLASRREYHFFSDDFDFVRSSPVRSRPLQLAVETERDKRVAKITLRHLRASLPPLPSSRATDPSRPLRPRLREGRIAAAPPAPPPATPPPAPRGSIRLEAPPPPSVASSGRARARETKSVARPGSTFSGNASVDGLSVASARRRSFRNREVFAPRATARRRACRGASACARADRYRCPPGRIGPFGVSSSARIAPADHTSTAAE